MENEYIVEAMRQLRQELGSHNVVFVHLTYLPYLAATKELKTKPTQNSVKDLRMRGITPDFLITRADADIPDSILEKVAFFCGVSVNHVIPAPTVESIYQIPLDFSRRHIGTLILDQLKLSSDRLDMSAWEDLYKNIQASVDVINIGMVGKYV
jgi:CTP synthase